MKPILRSWMLLLVGAIVFVGGMFWVRANSSSGPQDPLLEAQQDLESVFGMKVALQANQQGGLQIEAVTPGGPAEHVGLAAGDRVVACGDKSVWHSYQLLQFVQQQMESAPAVVLLVERDGEYRQVVFGRPRHG
jgi:S1-C subfamily serine protease